MSSLVLRFALPGGRRVVVAYRPAKDEPATARKPMKVAKPPRFDRTFGQLGFFVPMQDLSNRERGRPKRTR